MLGKCAPGQRGGIVDVLGGGGKGAWQALVIDQGLW